jgi:hypothetical protein
MGVEKMKNRYIKTAVAVALSATAGSALAFNPSVTPPDYQIVFSGATASSNSVRDWIIDRVCDPGQSIDVFRRWTGTSYGNDWAVACKPSTWLDVNGNGIQDAGETVASKNVLFRKRDTGGSGWGVTPVTHPMNVAPGVAATSSSPLNPGGAATGYLVDIMTVTAGAGSSFNCDTTVNPAATKTTGVGTSFTEYKCGSANEQKVPDAGFSDIEPTKFFGINTPAGLPEYAVSTGVSINTFGALVFGIPVTLDLRNALQAVQGKTVGAEDVANMPSLSSTEIRSLLNGGIPNWNNIMVTDPANPAGAKIPLANHPAVIALGTVPADKKVQICRRVPGSGTQAQANAIWLNWPCDKNVALPASEPGNPVVGPVVANNSGSSDVSRCLDDFNQGTNTSGKNSSLVKRWAIGINSTENNVNNSFHYRFIKVDGAPPTIQAVHAGDYYDYAEQSFQYRTNADRLLNASLAADKTDTLTILSYMAAQGNTPNDTAIINTNYVFTWGQGGWLVTPKSSGGFTPSNPFDINNPVNSSTRAPFGKVPNTCQFPTVIKTVTVD